MKKTILFLLCLITGSFAFSQDVIYRFSEYELATIRAKVIKVTPEVVEYKDVNQPNGHVKSIKIKDVYMIVYQDGRKEVFNGKAGKSGSEQSKPKSEKGQNVSKASTKPSAGVTVDVAAAGARIKNPSFIYKFGNNELIEIESNIVEITPEVIKYRDLNQPDGPVENIRIQDVYKIKYNDGSQQVFNKQAPQQESDKQRPDSSKGQTASKNSNQPPAGEAIGGGTAGTGNNEKIKPDMSNSEPATTPAEYTNEVQKKQDFRYRRSSLYTIMIDDEGLINGPVIKDAFMHAPIPDNFNDHILNIRTLNLNKYALTPEDRAKDSLAQKPKTVHRGIIYRNSKESASTASVGQVEAYNTKDVPLMINKFLKVNNIARGMVAKWFNRSEKGTFNMNLISERGFYDATEMRASITNRFARGRVLLSDAGEELIAKTFVLVTRFHYLSKEELAASINAAANEAGKSLDKNGKPATSAAVQTNAILGKGYVVQTTSYLYKLVWNDSIANIFYLNLWIDESNYDQAKKLAFDKVKLFKFELIGDETAWAAVQSTIYTKKSEAELIRIATVRAMDAVIAKLEKKYEIFRTKTPLYSVNPCSAKIGLKEGVEAGDKFEVLEQTVDPKTGKTIYQLVGKIKVNENQIWDNRFMAGEMQTNNSSLNQEIESAKLNFNCTLFEGTSKKYIPGMLLRQCK